VILRENPGIWPLSISFSVGDKTVALMACMGLHHPSAVSGRLFYIQSRSAQYCPGLTSKANCSGRLGPSRDSNWVALHCRSAAYATLAQHHNPPTVSDRRPERHRATGPPIPSPDCWKQQTVMNHGTPSPSLITHRHPHASGIYVSLHARAHLSIILYHSDLTPADQPDRRRRCGGIVPSSKLHR
jgi:hypothetical protein